MLWLRGILDCMGILDWETGYILTPPCLEWMYCPHEEHNLAWTSFEEARDARAKAIGKVSADFVFVSPVECRLLAEVLEERGIKSVALLQQPGAPLDELAIRLLSRFHNMYAPGRGTPFVSLFPDAIPEKVAFADKIDEWVTFLGKFAAFCRRCEAAGGFWVDSF